MTPWQHLDQPRPAWHTQAACQGAGPTLFYPGRGDTTTTRQAQHICKTCPVKQQCLDHAIDTGETHGVWGGLTGRALDRERTRRNRAARAVA